MEISFAECISSVSCKISKSFGLLRKLHKSIVNQIIVWVIPSEWELYTVVNFNKEML